MSALLMGIFTLVMVGYILKLMVDKLTVVELSVVELLVDWMESDFECVDVKLERSKAVECSVVDLMSAKLIVVDGGQVESS